MSIQLSRLHLTIPRRQSQAMLLIIRLTGVLLLYGFTRWLFYFANIGSFDHLNVWELLHLMFRGVRYDLVAIAITNLPLIVMATIPFHFRYNDSYQKILRVLFVVINSFVLVFNLIDVIFFRYIAKRTTSEVFAFFGNPAENTTSLMWTFLSDFWYMLLIFMIIVWLLYKLATWFIGHSPSPVRMFRWYVTHSLIFVVFLLLTVVFARGGLQLKPISLINAANSTESRNVPLLINTPFSIMQTIGDQELEKINYFTDEEVHHFFNPIHTHFAINQYLDEPLIPENPNIVILIVESLGRDYIGYYNPNRQALTPFVDSLLGQSITFNGFANGKRSNEALPSILTSLPSLMDKEFQATPFIANQLKGLGTIVKKKGYQTAFFHGGNNGTMRFDDFSHISGFDQYFGRNEYNNDADFDGRWGIFDEPYLQYFAKKLNSFQQPFAVGLFTLSSHHPYQLPDKYKHAFPQAANDMEATFCYTDHALKAFFSTAAQSRWFNNTIFVITADHTPEKSHFDSYQSYWGLYGVPIAFYIPSANKALRVNAIAQHADILPSLLALLKSNEKIVSFGRNLFDANQTPFAINYLSGIYQMIWNDTLAIFTGRQPTEVYDLSTDAKMQNNLQRSGMGAMSNIQNRFEAIRQQYNNRLINNQLVP